MAGEASDQMAVLCALSDHECRDIGSLAAIRPDLNNRRIVKAMGRLILRGLAQRLERGCYLLTAEGQTFREAGEPIKSGPKGPLNAACRRPRQRTMRDRLWDGLRIRGKASMPELLELAGSGSEDGKNNARHYLRALTQAGYLQVLSRRQEGTSPTSNGFKRYARIRDSGPQAPQWRTRAKQVYDPNTNETFDLAGGGQ